jgi:Ca2+-binding EF-hand superfamily protein
VRDQVIFYWTLVARHLTRFFDSRPHLRPHLDRSTKVANHQIALTKAQEEQISEIFALFDTDGGGSIDRNELEFAMMALGFQNQDNQAKGREADAAASSSLLDSIAGDGRVTLSEFSALMTGEVLGRNQFEEAQTVFAALSRSDGEARHDGLITFGKLEAACLEYGVIFLSFSNSQVDTHALL